MLKGESPGLDHARKTCACPDAQPREARRVPGARERSGPQPPCVPSPLTVWPPGAAELDPHSLWVDTDIDILYLELISSPRCVGSRLEAGSATGVLFGLARTFISHLDRMIFLSQPPWNDLARASFSSISQARQRFLSHRIG